MKSKNQFNLGTNKYLSGWINAYQQNSDSQLWKTEPIEFLPNYAKIFKEKGIRKVLDVGCGDGRNSLYLMEYGFQVIGFDLSPQAVIKANSLAESHSLTSGFFLEVNVENLPSPFVPEMFDVLVCLDAFGQFMHIEEVIRSFKIIVKRGGYLLINLYTPNDASYGQGQKLNDKSFLYKDTLFRYFTDDDVKTLFTEFNILEVKKLRWEDPPHPEYRDYPHTHESNVIFLQNI